MLHGWKCPKAPTSIPKLPVCMANPKFLRRKLVVASVATSLQTRTSTVTSVFTVVPTPKPETNPSGLPAPPPPQLTQPAVVRTETSLIVTVVTVTLTGVFAITQPGSTPAISLSLPTSLDLESSKKPSARETLTPTSTSLSSTSPHPTTITQSSTVKGSPITELPLLPTRTADHSAQGLNKTLTQVLPSVLLPLISIIILAYVLLHILRRRKRSATPPILVPFPDSNRVSRSIGFAKNVSLKTKQSGTATVIGGVTPGHTDVGAGSMSVVVEEPELLTSSSDNLVVPASRSEILELQTRLANIEARRISLPPPEYSSERE